jgi:arylsulfatase A-like enzyme
MIGEILKENGYATSWFGKDHNTPAFQASQAGPFDEWSAGMGFEYFYGFVGGDTSQWQPNLFRNTAAIYPYVGKPGWNLTTATADDATCLNQLNAILLLLCAAGGTHAPHYPTPEWIEKFNGKFDIGRNDLRDQIFRQPEKARRHTAKREAQALAQRFVARVEPAQRRPSPAETKQMRKRRASDWRPSHLAKRSTTSRV